MLARYVQRLPTSPNSSSTPTSILAPLKTTSPPYLLAHAAGSPPTLSLDSLEPPVIPDRPVHRERRKRNEREMLAGPSNSGVEPPSLTGTGSGIRFDLGAETGRKTKRIKLERSPSSPAIAPIDSKDESRARDLIRVLEKLFEDSLVVPMAETKMEKGQMSPTSGTNEEYLGHLLENDDLSGGWTYLNLVCTMAQVHRFNVTIPFIRSAVHSLSDHLELSSDGTKIRWIGPLPHHLATSQRPAPEAAASPAPSRASSSSRSVSTLGNQDTSSSEGAARGFDSNGTSTEASTAATSIAPHPSEILHKARPAPSNLRIPSTAPATTLDESSGDLSAAAITSSDEEKVEPASAQAPWAHQFVPCPYRSQGGQMATRTPTSEDSSTASGEKEGTFGTPAVGTIIFYSEAGFCSDFSKTAVLPHKNLPRSIPLSPLGDQQSEAEREGEGDTGFTAAEPFLDSLKPVDDLAVFYGAEGTSTSLSDPNSPTSKARAMPDSALDIFRTTTGMSSSVTTDLFTLLVKSRWTSLPPLSPVGVVAPSSAFNAGDLAAFPVKQPRVKLETVAATTIYHETRIIPRRPIFLQTLSSDDDSLTQTTSSRSSSPNEVSCSLLIVLTLS